MIPTEVVARLSCPSFAAVAARYAFYDAKAVAGFTRRTGDASLGTEFVFVGRKHVYVVDPRYLAPPTRLTHAEFARRGPAYWLSYPTGWASVDAHVFAVPEAVRAAAWRHILNRGGRVTKRVLIRQVEGFVYGRTSACMSKRGTLMWLMADSLWRVEGDMCAAPLFTLLETPRFNKLIAPRGAAMAEAWIEGGTVRAPFGVVLKAAVSAFCTRLHLDCSTITDHTLMRYTSGAASVHIAKADRKRRSADANMNTSMPPCVEAVYYPVLPDAHAKDGDRWRMAATVKAYAMRQDISVFDIYNEARSAAAWGEGKAKSQRELHYKTIRGGKAHSAMCRDVLLCPFKGDAGSCARMRRTEEPATYSPLGVWTAPTKSALPKKCRA